MSINCKGLKLIVIEGLYILGKRISEKYYELYYIPKRTLRTIIFILNLVLWSPKVEFLKFVFYKILFSVVDAIIFSPIGLLRD